MHPSFTVRIGLTQDVNSVFAGAANIQGGAFPYGTVPNLSAQGMAQGQPQPVMYVNGDPQAPLGQSIGGYSVS